MKLLSAVSKRKAAEQAFALFTTPPTREKRETPPLFKKAESLAFDFDGVKIQGYRWNHPKTCRIRCPALRNFRPNTVAVLPVPMITIFIAIPEIDL